MASQEWIRDVEQELFDKFQEETGVEVKAFKNHEKGVSLSTIPNKCTKPRCTCRYKAGPEPLLVLYSVLASSITFGQITTDCNRGTWVSFHFCALKFSGKE